MIAVAARKQDIPLKMVGGNRYGRYPKISDEQTFNLYISDDWMVNYAAYEVAAGINQQSVGRHLFTSSRWGHMLAIIGNAVYGVSPPASNSETLQTFFIGNINTFEGDVFIDENIAGQIAICDGQAIWIYNWQTPSSPPLIAATLPVDQATNEPIIPGYITYQDGYFHTVNKASAGWFLSAPNDGLNWNWGAGSVPVFAYIQTKPTNAVAVLRAPGRGNLLYLFGTNVTEMWYDVGAQLFPYQRSTSVSIDYGCLSPNTIAAMDTYVAWLGINERSGPVIMISSGSDITRISTDGIDFKLGNLKNPARSTGFFFKEDGHLFYQITFHDERDNFSLVYDFNTQMFFSPTDENMNYHIAESVAYYNDSYYFVSINDGNIYKFSSDLFTYNYTLPGSNVIKEYEVPRVRVCAPVRMANSASFVVNNLSFTMEQGNDPKFIGYNPNLTVEPYVPRVDISMSKDGANSFSSYFSKDLNPQGKRKNRVAFWQLGFANDVTYQFRFWSKYRLAVGDGVIEAYQ